MGWFLNSYNRFTNLFTKSKNIHDFDIINIIKKFYYDLLSFWEQESSISSVFFSFFFFFWNFGSSLLKFWNLMAGKFHFAKYRDIKKSFLKKIWESFVSQNIRKAFFWENIRHFFRTGVFRKKYKKFFRKNFWKT